MGVYKHERGRFVAARVKTGDIQIQRVAIFGAASFAATFLLSSFATFDVGMGFGISLSLMDIALQPCARFLKLPWQIACFVVPIALSQLLWGNLFTMPCIVIVRLVCVLMVSKIYTSLPEAQRNGSILPFLTHGFWLLVGVGIYDAFVFGLIRCALGILVSLVEWVIAGGLSVLLMRYLSRTIFKSDDREALS
jgi:hypothetical protein